MQAISKAPLLITLIVLLALTIGSWLLGNVIPLEEKTLGTAIIALAFIKVRLIVIHFMEAHKAQRPIRLVFEGWVFLTAAIIIGLIWL